MEVTYWEVDPITNELRPIKKYKNKESKETNEECNHDWKIYVGFTKSFKYCAICDAKQDME